MVKLLINFMLLSLLGACFSAKPKNFAFDAPVKKIRFEPAFPDDLIYQFSPDEKIIIGKKNLEPAIFEISGFEAETGKKLWQSSIQGEVVGQTEKQILIYEEKTATLYFIAPKDGQIARQISPAPNPLTSKNSLERGMAFTDEFYLTTKALYTSIWKSGQADESFKIGVTAKSWDNDEIKWFAPPVKQIVTIENRPVISGDKVLIINPPQTIDGDQTYQIIALKTGEELFRGKTTGVFFYIGKDFFIERTDSFVRRIEPFTNREIWKIEGDFKKASVSAVGSQITVTVPNAANQRVIYITNAETGKVLRQFDLAYDNTPLNSCFLTKDDSVLLNFAVEKHRDIEQRDFNYWVGFDVESKKAVWRTDFNSQSAGSLISIVGDKFQVKESR